MKDLKENIICAAIWYKDIELINYDILEQKGFRPYNCDRGIVFSGWRHYNCLYQMVAITGKSEYEVGEIIRGFLTNKNRFVDRYEGADIWKDNGGTLEYSKVMLYSEDLY